MEQDIYDRSFSPQRPRSRISSEYSGASTTHPVEWQDDWIHREEQFKDTINALHTEQERIQKKTFTNWINSHVEHHRDQWNVSDLFTDLKDGRILLALLEVITGDYLPCETFRHYTRAHYLSNVERALDYLRHRNIKLVNINSSDVVDGNETVILGLIWTIILNFQIDQDLAHLRENFLISPLPSGMHSGSYDSRSRSVSPSPSKKPRLAARGRFQAGASKAMLKWCQKEISDCYGIPITNLSTSWKDGMAFLGLVKVLDPKLIHLNDYRNATPAERMNVAFTMAQEPLGVPKFLEVADIDVDRPDERSIMTYVAQFIKRFPEAKRNRQKMIMDSFPDVEALEANEKAEFERIRDWCNDVLLMLKCLELSEERPYEAYDEYKKFSQNFRTNISSYIRLKERYEEGRTLHVTEQNILELDGLWARLISEKQIWHNHLFRVLLGQEQLLCSRFEKYESELDQRVLLPPQRVTHYSKVNLEFRVHKHEDILLRLTHLRDELNAYLIKEYPTEVFALHDLSSELNGMIFELEQRLLEERCKMLLKRQLMLVDEWERRVARWEEFLRSPGANGERLAYEFELHVVQERIFDKFLELSKQLQRCLEVLQNTPESDKHQRAEFLSSAVNANRRWKRIGEQLYDIREKLRDYQMSLKKKGQRVDLDYNAKDVPNISLSSTSPVSSPAYLKSERWLLYIQKVAIFTRWIDRMERDFEAIDRENVSRVEYQRGLQRFRALCNEVVEHKTDGQDIIDTFYSCSAELPPNIAAEEQRKINRLIRRYDSLIPSLEIVRSEVERNVHAHQVTNTHTETVQLVPDRPQSSVREHAVRVHTPAGALSPTISIGTSGYATPEFETALLRRSEPTTPSSFNRSPPLAYGISSQSSVNEGSPIEPSLMRDIDIDDENQRSASAASLRGTPAHTPASDERTYVRDVPLMDAASSSGYPHAGDRKGKFQKGTVEKFEQTVTETTSERSMRNVTPGPEEISKISSLRAAFERPSDSQPKFTTKPKPGSVYDALRRKSQDSDSDEEASPKKRTTSSKTGFLRSADDELTRLRQRPAGIVFESDVSNADVERAMRQTPDSPPPVSEKPKYLRNVKTTTLVTSTETKTVRTVRAKSPPNEEVPYLGSGRLVGKVKHPVAFTTETQVRDEPTGSEPKAVGKVRPAAVFTTPTETYVRRSSQEKIPQGNVRSHLEDIRRRESQEDLSSPTSEPESKASTPLGFLKKHTKTEFEETTKTVKRVTVSPLSSAKRGNRVEPSTVVRDDVQDVASPVREEVFASFVREDRPPPRVVREPTVVDPTQTFVRSTERVVLRPHRMPDTEEPRESVVRVVPYGAVSTPETDTPRQVNRLTNLFERATTDPSLVTNIIDDETVERVRVSSPERQERTASYDIPGQMSVGERVRRYEVPDESQQRHYEDIFAPLDSSPGQFSVMETSLSSPTSTVVREAVVTEYPPEVEREELMTSTVTEETRKPRKGLFGIFRSKKVAPEENVTTTKIKKEPIMHREVNSETIVREDRWDIPVNHQAEFVQARSRTGSVPHRAGVSDAEFDDTIIKNGFADQPSAPFHTYPPDVQDFLGTSRKPMEFMEEHVATRNYDTDQPMEQSHARDTRTFVRDAVPVPIESLKEFNQTKIISSTFDIEMPYKERLVTANEFIEDTTEPRNQTKVRDIVSSFESVSHKQRPDTEMETDLMPSRMRPSPVEHAVGTPDYDMTLQSRKRPVSPLAAVEHMEESILKRKTEKPAETVVRRATSPPPVLGRREYVEESIMRRTDKKPKIPAADETASLGPTYLPRQEGGFLGPRERSYHDIRHAAGPRDVEVGLVGFDEGQRQQFESLSAEKVYHEGLQLTETEKAYRERPRLIEKAVFEMTPRHEQLYPERIPASTPAIKTKSETVYVEHVPSTRVVTHKAAFAEEEPDLQRRTARILEKDESEERARRSKSPTVEYTEETVHKRKIPVVSVDQSKPAIAATVISNVEDLEPEYAKQEAISSTVRPEPVYHRGGYRDDIFTGDDTEFTSDTVFYADLPTEPVHQRREYRKNDFAGDVGHLPPGEERLEENISARQIPETIERAFDRPHAPVTTGESSFKRRSPATEYLEESVTAVTVPKQDPHISKSIVKEVTRKEDSVPHVQRVRWPNEELEVSIPHRSTSDSVRHHGGFGDVDRWCDVEHEAGPSEGVTPEPTHEIHFYEPPKEVVESVAQRDRSRERSKPRTVKFHEENVMVEHRPTFPTVSPEFAEQIPPVSVKHVPVPKAMEPTLESLEESVATTTVPREHTRTVVQDVSSDRVIGMPQIGSFETTVPEIIATSRPDPVWHRSGFKEIDVWGQTDLDRETKIRSTVPALTDKTDIRTSHTDTPSTVDYDQASSKRQERQQSPTRTVKIHEEYITVEHRPSSPVPTPQFAAQIPPVSFETTRVPTAVEPTHEHLHESVTTTTVSGGHKRAVETAVPDTSSDWVQTSRDEYGRSSVEAMKPEEPVYTRPEPVWHRGGLKEMDVWSGMDMGYEVETRSRVPDETENIRVSGFEVPTSPHYGAVREETERRHRSPDRTVKIHEEIVMVEHRPTSPVIPEITAHSVERTVPVTSEPIPARTAHSTVPSVVYNNETVRTEHIPTRTVVFPESETAVANIRPRKAEKIAHFVPLSDRGFESRLFSPAATRIREKIYQSESVTSSVSKKVPIFNDESGIEFARAAEERVVELESVLSGQTSLGSKRSSTSILKSARSVDDLGVQREKPTTILESMGVRKEPVIQMEPVPPTKLKKTVLTTDTTQYVIPQEKRRTPTRESGEQLQETITKTRTKSPSPARGIAVSEQFKDRSSVDDIWHRTTPRDIDITSFDLEERSSRPRELDEISTRAVTPASERIPKFIRMDEDVRTSSRTDSEKSAESIRRSPTLKIKSETVHTETVPSPKTGKEEHIFSYELSKEDRPWSPQVETLSESIRTHRSERTKQLGSEVKLAHAAASTSVTQTEDVTLRTISSRRPQYVADVETPWVPGERPDAHQVRHRGGVRDDYTAGFDIGADVQKPVIPPRRSRERSVERLEESVSEVTVPSVSRSRKLSPETQVAHMETVRPVEHAEESRAVASRVRSPSRERSTNKKLFVQEETVVVTTKRSIKPVPAPTSVEDDYREHGMVTETAAEESERFLERPYAGSLLHRSGPRDVEIASMGDVALTMDTRLKEAEEETVANVRPLHRPFETQEDLAVSSATKRRPAEEHLEEYVTTTSVRPDKEIVYRAEQQSPRYEEVSESRLRPEGISHVTGISDQEIVYSHDQYQAEPAATRRPEISDKHSKLHREKPTVSPVTETSTTTTTEHQPAGTEIVSESGFPGEESTSRKSGLLGFLRSGKGKKEENVIKPKSSTSTMVTSSATTSVTRPAAISVGLKPRKEEAALTVEELIHGSKKHYGSQDIGGPFVQETIQETVAQATAFSRGEGVVLVYHHPGCADKDYEPTDNIFGPVFSPVQTDERILSTTVAGYPADEEKTSRPSSRQSAAFYSFIPFDKPEKSSRSTTKGKKEKRASTGSTSGRSTPSSFTSATISDSEMPTATSKSKTTQKFKQVTVKTEKKASVSGQKIKREEIYEDILFTRPPSRKDKLEYVVKITASSDSEVPVRIRDESGSQVMSPRDTITPEPTKDELVVHEYASSESASPTFEEYFTVPLTPPEVAAPDTRRTNESVSSVTGTRTKVVHEISLEERGFSPERRTTLEFLPGTYTVPIRPTEAVVITGAVIKEETDFQPDRRTSLEFPVLPGAVREKVVQAVTEEAPSHGREERLIHNVGLSERNYEVERRTSLEYLPPVFDREKAPEKSQMQSVPEEMVNTSKTVVRTAEPDFVPERRTSLEFTHSRTVLPSAAHFMSAVQSEDVNKQPSERIIRHVELSERNYEPERRTSLEYLPAPPEIKRLPVAAEEEDVTVTETAPTENVSFEPDRRTSLEFMQSGIVRVRHIRSESTMQSEVDQQRSERVVHHTGLSDRNYEPDRRTSLEYLPVIPGVKQPLSSETEEETMSVAEVVPTRSAVFEPDRRTSLEFSTHNRRSHHVTEHKGGQIVAETSRTVRKMDNTTLADRQYEDERRTSLEFLPSLPVLRMRREETIVEESVTAPSASLELTFESERRTSLEFQSARPQSPLQPVIQEILTTSVIRTVVPNYVSLSDRNYAAERRTSLEFLPETSAAVKLQQEVIAEELVREVTASAQALVFEPDRRTSLEFSTLRGAKLPKTDEVTEEYVRAERATGILHNVSLGDRDFEPERRTSLEFLPEVQITRVRPVTIVEEVLHEEVAVVNKPAFEPDRRTSLEFVRDRPVRPPRTKHAETSIPEEPLNQTQMHTRTVHHVSLEERDYQTERRSTLEFLPFIPAASTKPPIVDLEQVSISVEKAPEASLFEPDRRTSLEFNISRPVRGTDSTRAGPIVEEDNVELIPRDRPEAVRRRSGLSDDQMGRFHWSPLSAELLSETGLKRNDGTIQQTEHVRETTTYVRPAEPVEHELVRKSMAMEEISAQKAPKEKPTTVQSESMTILTTSSEKLPKKKGGLFGIFRSGKEKKSESETATHVREMEPEFVERRPSVSSSTASSISSARDFSTVGTDYEEPALVPRERPDGVKHKIGIPDYAIVDWAEPLHIAKTTPTTMYADEHVTIMESTKQARPERVRKASSSTSSSDSESDEETQRKRTKGKIRTKTENAAEPPTVVRREEYVVEHETPKVEVVRERPVARPRTPKQAVSAGTVETFEQVVDIGYVEQLEPRARPVPVSHWATMSDLAMDDYAIARLNQAGTPAELEEEQLTAQETPYLETEITVREVPPEIIRTEHETVTEEFVPDTKERKKSKSIFGLFKRKGPKSVESQSEVPVEQIESEIVVREEPPRTYEDEPVGPPRNRPALISHRSGLADYDITDEYTGTAQPRETEIVGLETIVVREVPEEKARVIEHYRVTPAPSEESFSQHETVVTEEDLGQSKKEKSKKGIFGLFKSKKSREYTTTEVVTEESEVEHIERTHPEVFQPVHFEREQVTETPRERPHPVEHRGNYPDWELESHIPADVSVATKRHDEEQISETVVVRESGKAPIKARKVRREGKASSSSSSSESESDGERKHRHKGVVVERERIVQEEESVSGPPRERPLPVHHRGNYPDWEIERNIPADLAIPVAPRNEEHIAESVVVQTVTETAKKKPMVRKITRQETSSSSSFESDSDEEKRRKREVATIATRVLELPQRTVSRETLEIVQSSQKFVPAFVESARVVSIPSPTRPAAPPVRERIDVEEDQPIGLARERPVPVHHRSNYPDFEMEKYIPAEIPLAVKPKDVDHFSESVTIREIKEPTVATKVIREVIPVAEPVQRIVSREILDFVESPQSVIPVSVAPSPSVVVERPQRSVVRDVLEIVERPKRYALEHAESAVPVTVVYKSPVEEVQRIILQEELVVIQRPEFFALASITPMHPITVVHKPAIQPPQISQEMLEITERPEKFVPTFIEPTQSVVVVHKPIVVPPQVSREMLEIIERPERFVPSMMESVQPVVVEHKPIVEPPQISRETLEVIGRPERFVPAMVESAQPITVEHKPIVQPPQISHEILQFIERPEHFVPAIIDLAQPVMVEYKPVTEPPKISRETLEVVERPDHFLPTIVESAQPVMVEHKPVIEPPKISREVLEITERPEPFLPVIVQSAQPIIVEHKPVVEPPKISREVLEVVDRPERFVPVFIEPTQPVLRPQEKAVVTPTVLPHVMPPRRLEVEKITRSIVRDTLEIYDAPQRFAPTLIEPTSIQPARIAVIPDVPREKQYFEERVMVRETEDLPTVPLRKARARKVSSSSSSSSSSDSEDETVVVRKARPASRVLEERIEEVEEPLMPRERPPAVFHSYNVPDRDLAVLAPRERAPSEECLQESVVTVTQKTAKPPVPARPSKKVSSSSSSESETEKEQILISRTRVVTEPTHAAPSHMVIAEHLAVEEPVLPPRQRPPRVVHRYNIHDRDVETLSTRYPVVIETTHKPEKEIFEETVTVVTTAPVRLPLPVRTEVVPVEEETIDSTPRDRPPRVHHRERFADFEIEPAAVRYSPALVELVPERRVEERVPREASEHLKETVRVVSTPRERSPSPMRTTVVPLVVEQFEHLVPRERPSNISHRGKVADYEIEPLAAKYAADIAESAPKPLKPTTTEYEHVTVTTKTVAEPSVKFGVSERSKMIKDVYALESGPAIVSAKLIPAERAEEFVTVREVSPPIRVAQPSKVTVVEQREELVTMTPRERPARVYHRAGLGDENINMLSSHLVSAPVAAVKKSAPVAAVKKAKKVATSSSSSSSSDSEREKVVKRKARTVEKVRNDISSDEEIGRSHSERVRHVHLENAHRKPTTVEDYAEAVTVRRDQLAREAMELPSRERPEPVEHFVGESDVKLEDYLVTREPAVGTDETVLEETVFQHTKPRPGARKTKSEELFEESERRVRGEIVVHEEELMKQKKFTKGRRSPSPGSSSGTEGSKHRAPTKVLVRMDDKPTVVRSAESTEYREETKPRKPVVVKTAHEDVTYVEEAKPKKPVAVKTAHEEVTYFDEEETKKREAVEREREIKSRTGTPGSLIAAEAISRSASGTRSRTPDGSTKLKSVKVTKTKVEKTGSKEKQSKEYIFEDVNYYKTAKRSKTPDALSRGHTLATTSFASASPESEVMRAKTLPYKERSPDETIASERITTTAVRDAPLVERERMEERVRKTAFEAAAIGKKGKKKRSSSSSSSSSSREDADEITSVTLAKAKLTSPTPEPRDDVHMAFAEMQRKVHSSRETSDEEITVARARTVSPDRIASPPPILHKISPGDAEIEGYLRKMRPFPTGEFVEHEIQPVSSTVQREHEAVTTHTVTVPAVVGKGRKSLSSSTSSTESEDEHGRKVRRKRRPAQRTTETLTTRVYSDEREIEHRQAGHRDSEIGVAMIERTKTEQLPSYISFGRLEPESPRRSTEYRTREHSLSPSPRDKILHRSGPKDFHVDYYELPAEPSKPPRRDKESVASFYYGETSDDVEGVFREVSHKRRTVPTQEMEAVRTVTTVHPEKVRALERSEKIVRTESRESSITEERRKPTTSEQTVTYVRESPTLHRGHLETSRTPTPSASGEYLEEHVEHYRVKLSRKLEELRSRSPKLYKNPQDIHEMRTVSGMSGQISRPESRTTSPAPLGLPYPPAYLVGRGLSPESERETVTARYEGTEKPDQLSPLKESTSALYAQSIKKRVIPTRDSIEDDMVVADVRQGRTPIPDLEETNAEMRTVVREHSVTEEERKLNRASTISETATYMEIPERHHSSYVASSTTAETLPVSSVIGMRPDVRRSRSNEQTPVYAKVQQKKKGYRETLEEDVFYWKLLKAGGKKSYSAERLRARSPENVLTADEIVVLQRSVSPFTLAEGDRKHRHKEKSERVMRSRSAQRSESDINMSTASPAGLEDSGRFSADGRERYDVDLRLTTTLGDKSTESSLSRRSKAPLPLPAARTPPLRSRQLLSTSPEETSMHVRSFSPSSAEFVSERTSPYETVETLSSTEYVAEEVSVVEVSRMRRGLLAAVESEMRMRAAHDDADMMYRAAMREPLPEPHSCLETYDRLYYSVRENLLELYGLIVDPDCQYIDQELLSMERQRFTAFLDGLVRINRDLDRLDDLYRALMTVESGPTIADVDTKQRHLNGLYMDLLQQLKSILRRIRHLEMLIDMYRKRRLQFKVRLLEELTYFRTHENMDEDEQKERVNLLLEEVLILRSETYNMFVRSTPEYAAQLEVELHEILMLLRTELRVPADIENYYGSIIQLLLTGRYSVEFDASEQKLILTSDEIASAEIPTSTSRFSNPTVWSVLRRALPMQALALILLGFASLIPMTDDEFSCLFSNYFASSFNPALKFSGPPPI